MQIKFAQPDISDQERREMNNFLLSIQNKSKSSLTHGEQNILFSEEFKKYIDPENKFNNYVCIPTSSCMAALHLSYMALGLQKNDEVIVPAMSHVATAHAVEHINAIPIFVDCDHNGNIDVDLIEKAITRKTRAVSCVHFLGSSVNIYHLKKLCEAYGLYLIEDCALALGSDYNDWIFGNYNSHVGLLADFSCYSFYPCKHITTGEGGMIVCKADFEYSIKQFMQFGKFSLSKKDYDITELGLNYRMDEMSAVMGRVQLRRLKGQQWIEKRMKNVQQLVFHITNKIETCVIQQDYSKLGSYALNIKFKTKELRDLMFLKLHSAGVECSVYYPHPIPEFTYYKDRYGYQKGRFKNAEEVAYRTLALPVHQNIGEEEINYMVDVLKK